jgi:PTS system, lactose/cellobiose family IIC component
MNIITSFIENNFAPLFQKMNTMPYFRGLRNGMTATVPFTIVGSFFIIFQQFPVDAWQTLIAPYKAMLGVPNTMTIGIIALYVAFAIAYNCAKEVKVDGMSAGLLSVMAFMMMQIEYEEFTLVTGSLGSRGIFPAILLAMLVVKVMHIFQEKNWTIKFPDGVPPAVSKAFASLYPAMLIMIVMFVVSVVLKIQIQEIIVKAFSPLVFALNTLPGILVYMLFAQLLWSAGIHGMSIMNTVGTPIFLSYITANMEASVAGQAIPYITAAGFIQNFVSIGGTGATLALTFLMARSKEEGFRTLGKLTIPTGIFNINEPVIFGFPLVLNPTMMLPFVFIPLFNATTSYLLMYFNIIGRPVAQVPWIMPAPIAAFLQTGDWKAAVWSTMLIIFAAIFYYPFFKAAEKERLDAEVVVAAE